VLLFTLRGKLNDSTGAVTVTKEYQQPVPEQLKVEYEGRLTWPESSGGRATLTGTWRNEMEGSHGLFGCVLQD
jgi:hypothetical protein